MGRKNRRKKTNKTKELYMYGRLVRKSKAVAYCELHRCYLEPKDILERKCNYKMCIHKIELREEHINGNESIVT